MRSIDGHIGVTGTRAGAVHAAARHAASSALLPRRHDAVSQVFDHTSLIRFIEARFDVVEPNIRRGVAPCAAT